MNASCADESTLRASRGVNFKRVWRWATGPLVYKPVVAVTSLTPLTLTVTAHGVTDGASVAFVELGGLDAINAKASPPRASDFHPATVVDANTLQFNTIDAARCDGAYTSGGKIVYPTPVDLAGRIVTLKIFDPGNPVTPLVSEVCTLDNVAKTISLNLAAADVTALTLPEYTYALLSDLSGDIDLLRKGTLLVDDLGAD